MNKKEFIDKQMRKFNSVTAKNVDIWVADYNKILSNPYIDYDKLDDMICSQYMESFQVPSTGLLKKYIPDCLKEEGKHLDPALVETRTMKEQAEPPSEECRQRVAEIKQKLARMKIAL